MALSRAARRLSVLLVAAAMLLALLPGLFRPRAPGAALPGAALPGGDLQPRLHAVVVQWLDEERLTRPDGYIYAIDISQLMFYAALCRDETLYHRLRDVATRQLIIDDPAEEFTRGFVAWRRSVGNSADASGTTEALRLAEALWRGSAAFGDPADRALALHVLAGYARHAYEDQGVWLIRNYYNLGTRSFASNSFLVDYDPDLLAEITAADPQGPWSDMAQRSSDLVAEARTPCGLLYDIIQPEVLTLMPELGAPIFSPNDMVQLSNAATVAERAARTRPDIARGVLDFALARQRSDAGLRTTYLGRTGEGASEKPAGVETYAALLRLALKLGDEDAVHHLAPGLYEHAQWFLREPYEPRLYVASEILLALEALKRERED